MFRYNYSTTINDSLYGSITISSIAFNPEDLENALPSIVFSTDNLNYMFADDSTNNDTRKKMYRRFIPNVLPAMDLDEYITLKLSENKVFYSFLAEGILTLVYRDLYSYSLSTGVIDLNETLSDTHTGVDACMYSLEHQRIILGEAKFYEEFESGIRSIIRDFTTNNITNKIESLHRKAINNDESSIILRNFKTNKYDEISLSDFLNCNITFAGFILHSEKNIGKFANKEYYNSFPISIEQIKQNIQSRLGVSAIRGNYEIMMVHLPIFSKKQLILSTINKAQDELNRIVRR